MAVIVSGDAAVFLSNVLSDALKGNVLQNTFRKPNECLSCGYLTILTFYVD